MVWNTTWIRFRSSRRLAGPAAEHAPALVEDVAEVGGSSWSTSRPRVLFPDPLSPTSPSIDRDVVHGAQHLGPAPGHVRATPAPVE